MQINISARHGQLSSATRDKLTAKVEKIRRLFERISAVDVTVDLAHNDQPGVELRLSIDRGADIVAAKSDETLWAAVDGAIHKLEKQVRKHKEKLTSHRPLGHKREGVSVETDVERE